MANQGKLLIVDDNEENRYMLSRRLARRGYEVDTAEDGREGLERIAGGGFDVVLLDIMMPGIDGLEVLRSIRDHHSRTELPVVMVTARESSEDVVGALELGANDYLTKPLDFPVVLARVENQLAIKRLAGLEQEVDYLRQQGREITGPDDVVARSPALRETMSLVDQVAPTEASVLVLGETGVGKEIVAESIHRRSRRAEGPLIKVNCASIPKELFESEFFGHVKGAFTGAVKDRAGRFQLADGGTLFLDEVGEIPLELQGKLLRVLQEGRMERVGEEVTRGIDVRIVAATNRDLAAEVAEHRFREDLYFRLNVFPVVIPPLRERRDDVEPLARLFLDRYGRRHGKTGLGFTEAHLGLLRDYPWPGNVRELQNVVERAVIVSRPGHLRLGLPGDAAASLPSLADPGADAPVLTFAELKDVERANIAAALRRSGGKVSGPGGAAALLGVKPTTLASRIKALGIERPSSPTG